MSVIRCIAVDDEPLALSVIEAFCKRYGGIEVSLFSDPEKGVKSIMAEKPDIVFLDIEMGSISGVDIAKILPPSVFLVFTTAYTEFAVKGFELNAVDYLHKPFSYQRFVKAVEKAAELMRLRTLAGAALVSEEEFVTVKSDYRNVQIPVSDILYAESYENYTKIVLADRPHVTSKIALRDFLAMLPDGLFVRIHKSYVVAVNRIESYSRREVVLFYRSLRLPVGRAYAESFVSQME